MILKREFPSVDDEKLYQFIGIFLDLQYQDLTDAYNEEYERIFNNNEAYDHSKQKFK